MTPLNFGLAFAKNFLFRHFWLISSDTHRWTEKIELRYCRGYGTVNNMSTTITKKQIVTNARRKITAVLDTYRLSWEDVVPDLDEALWNRAAPTARRVRRELFKKSYPSLY